MNVTFWIGVSVPPILGIVYFVGYVIGYRSGALWENFRLSYDFPKGEEGSPSDALEGKLSANRGPENG